MPIALTNNIGLARRLAAIVYDSILLFAVLLIASLPWVISGIQQGQAGYLFYVVFIYALIPLYYIGFLGIRRSNTWHENMEDARRRFGGSLSRMGKSIVAYHLCCFILGSVRPWVYLCAF